MEGLEFKRAKPDDAPWAARIMVESEPWITLGTTKDQCVKMFNDSDYRVFVARSNGTATGFIAIHPKGFASSPYIRLVCVEASYRGHGIGAGLMAYAEELMRDKARHIFLCVSAFNSGAQEFYKNLGYKKVGELEDYIVQGESEIMMHKRIQ